MDAQFKQLTKDGLWNNNAALVQLLGLCPLLAVSNSVVNALGLGLASIMVLVCSNLCVSLIRHQIREAIRLPAFVMIIATFTTCAELLMQAFAFELYLALGIFIPLIVTNCTILGRADAFASRNPLLPSFIDGVMMGVGFTAVLVILGAMREVIGTGTLFANMDLLFPFAGNWKITLFDSYPGFLLAVLPPGAFIFMGLLIALKNLIDTRLEKPKEVIEAGSKRVRVTQA